MPHLIIIDRRLLQLHRNGRHPILYQSPHPRGLTLAVVIRLPTFGKPTGLHLEPLLSHLTTPEVVHGPHPRTGHRPLVTSKFGMFSPNTRWVHRDVCRTNLVTQLPQPAPSHRHRCSAQTMAGRSEVPDIIVKNHPFQPPAALAWLAMSTHF